MFYHGTQTSPQWDGNGFVSGLATMSLNRIIFDGHSGAKTAERWEVGHRIRDVEQGPNGAPDAGRCQSRRPDPCDTQSDRFALGEQGNNHISPRPNLAL